MWTVTLGLKPLVVTAHLVGGMSVLALLWLLWLEAQPEPRTANDGLRPFAVFGLVLLAAQIILGGWTSSHYAGLACTGFPACNGEWWPQADFAAGFGERTLNSAGLIAIQWVHRLGAITVVLYLGWLAWRSHRSSQPVRQIGTVIALLLSLQFTIGIANVLTRLPLPLATAHNAIAALLLLALVTLNQRLADTRSAFMGESS
jgi:cytochrome c oxidase assembly protein subunit 15